MAALDVQMILRFWVAVSAALATVVDGQQCKYTHDEIIGSGRILIPQQISPESPFLAFRGFIFPRS